MESETIKFPDELRMIADLKSYFKAHGMAEMYRLMQPKGDLATCGRIDRIDYFRWMDGLSDLWIKYCYENS